MTTGSQSSGSNKRTKRILIVDDHPVVRERLAELLNEEPDLRVCGEAEDHNGALETIVKTKPHLAIVDLSLRDSSGLDLIKDIRKLHPNVAVVVLSMHDDSVYAERALLAGASGYLTKQKATREIISCTDSPLE